MNHGHTGMCVLVSQILVTHFPAVHPHHFSPPLLQLLTLLSPNRASRLSFISLQHHERKGTWSFSPAPPVTEGLVWLVILCLTRPAPPRLITTTTVIIISTVIIIIIMDCVMRVKRSLSAPIKKLSSCVSNLKGRRLRAKGRSRYRRGRGRGGRGGSNRSRRAPPPSSRNPQPVILRSYRADLEKQRQVDKQKHVAMTWNDFWMFQKMFHSPTFKILVSLCKHSIVTVWGVYTLFLQRANRQIHWECMQYNCFIHT